MLNQVESHYSSTSTNTRTIPGRLHIVPDEDMGCDATSGSGAMTTLTQKYGERAVSHDNSWFLRPTANAKKEGLDLDKLDTQLLHVPRRPPPQSASNLQPQATSAIEAYKASA
jgi:hypothetical protein